MPEQIPTSIDAFTPAQMAAKVQNIGVSKARMPAFKLIVLGLLAGGFISFGAINFTTVMAQGLPRLVAATAFALGLILVIVGGAELFTGNNLMAMAWAERKITTREVLRNWFYVYFANLIGCLALVALAYWSGILQGERLNYGVQALTIAAVKSHLPWWQAFFKGILCNSLVCLAVWLCFAARSVTDRIFAIVFPIAGFVNMGFEHSIANMFFIPMGMLASLDPAIVAAAHLPAETMADLNFYGFLRNISAVTLGNIFGGTVLVAGMYYSVYLRGRAKTEVPVMSAMVKQGNAGDGKKIKAA
jgi:formate/nitrite transporter